MAAATGDAIRCRLDVPKEQIPWGELHELATQGATDYVIMPLVFSDGRRSTFSCVTDRPGGFTQKDLMQLEHTALPLALRVELASAHIATSGLLNIYLIGRVRPPRPEGDGHFVHLPRSRR